VRRLLAPAALKANAPNTLPLPSNPRAVAAMDTRNLAKPRLNDYRLEAGRLGLRLKAA